MDKTTLLTILIGAMVVVSLLQTVQIMGLTSAASNATITGTTAAVGSGSTAPKTAPTTTTSTTSLNNLPSMVGGC